MGQAHRHHSGQYSGAEFSDKTHGLVVANVPFRHLDSAIGEPCIATGVCFDGPALCMLGRVADLAGRIRDLGSRICPDVWISKLADWCAALAGLCFFWVVWGVDFVLLRCSGFHVEGTLPVGINDAVRARLTRGGVLQLAGNVEVGTWCLSTRSDRDLCVYRPTV